MIAMLALIWTYFIPISCIRAFPPEVYLNKLDVVAREVATRKKADPVVPSKSIIVSSVSRKTVHYLHGFNCQLNRLHMMALLVAFDDMSYNYTKKYFSTSGTDTDRTSITSVLWRGFNYPGDIFYAEKLTLVLALLELGYDALYTDITTSIQRNPFASIPNNNKISFLFASEVPCNKWVLQWPQLKPIRHFLL